MKADKQNTEHSKTTNNQVESNERVQQGEESVKFDDRREHTSQLVQLQGKADSFIQKKSNSDNNTGLPDNLKSGIENLSGISMDDVKVHRNSAKPAQLNAHAFAQGNQIHLASGQEKHLPHEAWHVVQQKQGRVKPTISHNGAQINDDKGLEKEADIMSSRVMDNSQSKAPLTTQLSMSEVAQRITKGKEVVQWPEFIKVTEEIVKEQGREDEMQHIIAVVKTKFGKVVHKDTTDVKDEAGLKEYIRSKLNTWITQVKEGKAAKKGGENTEERSAKTIKGEYFAGTDIQWRAVPVNKMKILIKLVNSRSWNDNIVDDFARVFFHWKKIAGVFSSKKDLVLDTNTTLKFEEWIEFQSLKATPADTWSASQKRLVLVGGRGKINKEGTELNAKDAVRLEELKVIADALGYKYEMHFDEKVVTKRIAETIGNKHNVTVALV